jgi:hypothetical protein
VVDFATSVRNDQAIRDFRGSISVRFSKTIQATALAAALAATPVFAETWPDPLLTTTASPENVARGLQIDAYQLGISAWVWGYPLVRMERVIRQYTDVPNPKPATSYRAPLNRLGWARELATPDARDMPTANNDTVYLSAVVDLTEPYVLTVPDVGDRYYVVDVFNMWQELEHYIGRRTTGTKAGRFAIVPPGWKGDLPKDVTRLDVTTEKVWLWGRMRVSPSDDMGKIHALQDAFDLRPLSKLGDGSWTAPEAALPPLPEIKDDPYGFLVQLAAALKDTAIRPADTALAAQFERIGLKPGSFDRSNLSKPRLEGLARGLTDAPLVAVASVAATSQVRNGWGYVRGLDDFGYNYPLRALVAGPYLGGQGEHEAVYPIRYTDAGGETLSGKGSYVMRFSSPPPNDAFWSLTMYDATTKMLVQNPLQRYKVGNDTPGLKVDADGHFEIPISASKPDGAFAANWLPAPQGEFYLILRIYQPRDAVMSGQWNFPQVVKTDR